MKERKPTILEQQMIYNLMAHKIEGWVREYEYHPTTKQRFDFAWPTIKLAVECEGGVWTGGAHTRGLGFIKDCDKYNEATTFGWTVLRFANVHINSGRCVETIKLCIELLEGKIK